MIIDDETDFCKLVKLNLELMGNFEVAIATEGEQGIATAKEIKPDLILLDIVMPGIDGFEVLKRLKEDSNTLSIPVIMVTAKSDLAEKIQSAHLLDEEFIIKPVDAQDLRAKIEKTLAKKGG